MGCGSRTRPTQKHKKFKKKKKKKKNIFGSESEMQNYVSRAIEDQFIRDSPGLEHWCMGQYKAYQNKNQFTCLLQKMYLIALGGLHC
jgi:hypothetical protein